GDALAIASREFSDEEAPDVAEGQALDCGVNCSCRRLPGEPLQSGHEDEKFLDAHPAVERDIFGHVADPGPRRERIVHDIEPDDASGSGGWAKIAGEDSQDRGLPGAV